MEYSEFERIVLEEGWAKEEAEWLWRGKPKGHNPSDAGVRFA